MDRADLAPARTALAAAIPKLAAEFPPLPTLQAERTYLVHTSAYGAIHWDFEAPATETVRDYERLEHVGDALLGAEVTLLVHEKYPRLVVGARSLVKAALVENRTLALLSDAYDLPKQIRAAIAQEHSIRSNPAVRACVFEALLAAIHAEHGNDGLRAFVHGIYTSLVPIAVEALRPVKSSTPQLIPTGCTTVDVSIEPGDLGPFASSTGVHLSPISVLNEWTQKGGMRKIVWGAASKIGPAHCLMWDIKLVVHSYGEQKSYDGFGDSIGQAKAQAARSACYDLDLFL